MAGFQTMNMPRPVFGNGKPAAPTVDIRLVRPSGHLPPLPSAYPILATPPTAIGLRPKSYITTAMVKDMRARRARGESRAKIAKAVGGSEGAVQYHTDDVPPPEGGWSSGGHKSIASFEAIMRMRRAGFTYAEIGENYGLSASAIYYRVNRKRHVVPRTVKEAAIARNLQQVCRVSGLRATDIRRGEDFHAGRRADDIARARHILFWILRRKRMVSLKAAGLALGGFDHSSVHHGVMRVDRVVAALGISADLEMMVLIRALWSADWSVSRAARKAA
jgi:hypothetical protein